VIKSPNLVSEFRLAHPEVLNAVSGSMFTLDINFDAVTGLGVTSTNFRVIFNSLVLFLSKGLVDMSGSIMPDASVSLNDNTPGELLISLANPAGVSITQSGQLIRLSGYLLSPGDLEVSILPRPSPDFPLLPAPENPAVFPEN